MNIAAQEEVQITQSWLGTLPNGWVTKRLKYISTINDETLPENTDPDYEMLYVDIGSVDATEGIQKKEPMIFETAPSRARRVVQDGDTIVSTVRTYLRAVAPIRNPEQNLIVSTGFAVIRPKGINPHYLAYSLRSSYFIETVVSRSVGVSYPATNPTDVSCIELPLPPVDEQQTIARFLDAKTAQIDALVAQKRQLIDKLKEKRQALIARTVTRGLPPEAAKAAGLEPNPEMKDSGVDWLGETPAHWGEDKVARLFRAMKGRNAAQLTKEYCATIEGEYPVYSGQTENDGVMSSIDEFEFDAGEDGYLFSTTVGAKAMSLMHLKGKFSLSQNCMVIAPMSDKVQVRFYYYHLQPLFQFERGLIPEHMQASFRMEDLYQYRVAIPPKDEQRAIADYLDQVCATADDLLEVTERAIVKLNEYRQALITSAVTGKIDVRELA